jgi:hypothetical protein
LLAEWDRTNETYNQKVAHITGGASGGLNGLYVLNTTTVFDTDGSSQLDGATGGMNLYFADLIGPSKDRIKLLQPGEIVIEI